MVDNNKTNNWDVKYFFEPQQVSNQRRLLTVHRSLKPVHLFAFLSFVWSSALTICPKCFQVVKRFYVTFLLIDEWGFVIKTLSSINLLHLVFRYIKHVFMKMNLHWWYQFVTIICVGENSQLGTLYAMCTYENQHWIYDNE